LAACVARSGIANPIWAFGPLLRRRQSGAIMSKNSSPLNPSRFIDMLEEALYATGSTGKKLKAERKNRVAWLRKKSKKIPAGLRLADKL
jgi:hypothetical protein